MFRTASVSTLLTFKLERLHDSKLCTNYMSILLQPPNHLAIFKYNEDNFYQVDTYQAPCALHIYAEHGSGKTDKIFMCEDIVEYVYSCFINGIEVIISTPVSIT